MRAGEGHINHPMTLLTCMKRHLEETRKVSETFESVDQAGLNLKGKERPKMFPWRFKTAL